MDKNKDNVIKYKILLLGNTQVGKTSMLKRFCDEQYNEDTLSTIGIDAKTKFINHKDRKIQLDIWDTAGQERFLSITKNTYKGSDGIILMYDLTSKKTFNSINNWIKGIKEAIDINRIAIVLVGNKCDCKAEDRQVTFEEGEILAKEKDFPFFETSVKENINVNQVFIAILDKLFDLDIIRSKEQNEENQKLKNDDKKNGKVKKCCLDKKKKNNNDNNDI